MPPVSLSEEVTSTLTTPATGETRVMVVGSIVSGAVFQLNVDDKSKPVFVTLQQVAGKDYSRRSTGDYHVSVNH